MASESVKNCLRVLSKALATDKEFYQEWHDMVRKAIIAAIMNEIVLKEKDDDFIPLAATNFLNQLIYGDTKNNAEGTGNGSSKNISVNQEADRGSQ